MIALLNVVIYRLHQTAILSAEFDRFDKSKGPLLLLVGYSFEKLCCLRPRDCKLGGSLWYIGQLNSTGGPFHHVLSGFQLSWPILVISMAKIQNLITISPGFHAVIHLITLFVSESFGSHVSRIKSKFLHMAEQDAPTPQTGRSSNGLADVKARRQKFSSAKKVNFEF